MLDMVIATSFQGIGKASQLKAGQKAHQMQRARLLSALRASNLDNSRRQKNGLSLARIAITMQATKPCQISPAPS
jgi:hypothetical protein